MRLDTGLVARLEQRLRLAPQIIQSIEILQLPTLALEELISEELADNPVLEIAEPPPGDQATDEEPPGEADDEPNEIEEQLTREWEEFRGERPPSAPRGASDRKREAMLNTAARPISLHEFLLGQFHLLDVTGEVGEAGAYVIGNLDEHGYLTQQLDELVEAAEGRYRLSDVEEALRQVQTLEPLGVGARNLKECLLLQVGDEGHELPKRLIANHIEDIRENRLPKIARKTGEDIDSVKEAIEYISHLNPRPGSLFGGRNAPRIMPDLLVEYTDKGYEVRLEDGRVPTLAISKLYEKLAATGEANAEAKKYLREKFRAARWLLDAIEQRKTTLYRVTRAIVNFQKEFFDYGLSHLKPLRMQEVADKVGVHVSTVSRAISDKYIQTPRGIFPLKYFFTGGLSTVDGDVQTWRTVRQQIKDLVDSEDKSKPLSDDQIAALLSRRGTEVARRTVTKYRKALSIPSSRRRKSY